MFDLAQKECTSLRLSEAGFLSPPGSILFCYNIVIVVFSVKFCF